MSNYLEILMIMVALVLVIVIWSLSSVLAMIAKKVVEFSKTNKKVMMIIVVAFGTMFANQAMAQTDAAISDSTAAKVPTFYGGLSGTTFWTLSSVIALELLIVLLLVIFIRNLWNVLNPVQVIDKKMSKSWIIKTWDTLDKKFFTKAAPIEQEADILLKNLTMHYHHGGNMGFILLF